MRKPTVAALAATLTLALVAGPAGLALADDAPPPEAPAVLELPATTDAVVPEPSLPDPAPVVVDPPAPPAAARTATVHLAICHSGDGAHWTFVAPDAHGYNGHQHHDADVYGLTDAECLAKNAPAFDPYVAEGLWLIPASWNRLLTPSYQQAIFPQDRLPLGSAIPCDRWAQHDWYPIDNAAEEAVYASLGDVLDQGEDSSIYGSHEFVYGGDCAPPTVEVCETHTSTHSTDLAPAGWTGDGSHVDGGYSLPVAGDWDSSWIERDVNLPIEQALAELDIDASPLQYVGIHFLTEDGRWITFEEEPSYAGNLWSQSVFAGVPAGMGYPAYGSPDDFVAENAGLIITKARVLYTHPAASSTTVASVSFGCATYTFDKVDAPVIPEPRVEVIVVPSEYAGDEPTCDNPEVVWTRTLTSVTTTTLFRLAIVAGLYEIVVDRVEVGEPVVTIDTETQVRTYEGPACEVPPTEEPPTETPVPPATPSSSDGLADTGLELTIAALAALLLLVAGAATIAARRVIARR